MKYLISFGFIILYGAIIICTNKLNPPKFDSDKWQTCVDNVRDLFPNGHMYDEDLNHLMDYCEKK